MRTITRRARTFFGMPHANSRQRERLTDGTIESWMEAAQGRPSGVTPTIYDLVELCEQLKYRHPIQASQIIRNLRWLMKMSTRQSGSSWDHPWGSSR